MISFTGIWFDGKTSAAIKAICRIDGKGQVLVEAHKDRHCLLSIPQKNVKVSPRLADTPRHLYFPEGQKFETEDNAAVDFFVRKFKPSRLLDFMHRLESRWPYVFTALAILLVFLFITITYGIPFAAKTIAFRIPISVLDTTSRQTLEALDQSLLSPSELIPETKNRIVNHIQPVIQTFSNYSIRILFRKAKRIGPNAFALPNGVIVFTDEIVELSNEDDELLSILVHEIGHVVQRHSLRTLIQDSILGFVLLSLTGDVTGSSELFLGLPVLMTEMAYSRTFEREADDYALMYLQRNNISPYHFANLMKRIEREMTRKNHTSDKKWQSYLSTHPMTKERIQQFETELEE